MSACLWFAGWWTMFFWAGVLLIGLGCGGLIAGRRY